MSTISHSEPTSAELITDGAWGLDPTRSSVEFHVRHFWGLITVKGHFGAYQGTLDLNARPAVELTIQADSLDTKQRQARQAPALGRLLRRRASPAGPLRLRERSP